MWQPSKVSIAKKGTTGANGLVAVAIERGKGSQNALRWAADNLVTRGQTIVLIHVVQRPSFSSFSNASAVVWDTNETTGEVSAQRKQLEKMTKDLFLTFRCYCTRKDIHCLDVILEDTDVAKALSDYAAYAAIENLVLGAPAKHGFIRFKTSGIPSGVSKAAPDFCNVYVISKGKISTLKNANHSVPFTSPLQDYIRKLDTPSAMSIKSADTPRLSINLRDHRPSLKPRNIPDDPFKPRSLQDDSIKSPLEGGRGWNSKTGGGFSESEADISFVSSERPSTDGASSLFFDYPDSARTSRVSTGSEQSLGSIRLGPKWTDLSLNEFSSVSHDSNMTSSSWSSQNLEEVESEMRRLKLELKQTMDMYSTACREALQAKQKAMELQNWRLEEERRMEEVRLAQETAMVTANKEKVRCQAATEAANAAKRIAQLETHKRANVEMKAIKEAEEMRKVLDSLAQSDVRYRRYTFDEIELATEYFSPDRKIGEGGYGPVYKCYLDHTPVAVKVLRPDAAQGRSQYQQEIDVLSCIRHPNMVLLLGACPEYGILVYEYLANGSLDDRIFRKGNTPALSWQLRFRVAAEIATGLLFLHQTKPKPLVHRDLKPGNILLDHNFVSKISDVGLARLVPAVAENVTQYCMTSAAGTFCYIDPEYQQTGMLGVKSDVYSLGILLLQLITAKPPMGLAHHVESAIENGTFYQMLDPTVPDWPMEQVLTFAKLAVKCAELRRKDRPDLGLEALPELNKLREFAEENMNFNSILHRGNAGPCPAAGDVPNQQEEMRVSDPQLGDIESSKSQSSTSSQTG